METMLATTTALSESETRLSGRSISAGLGMGRAWVVGDVLKWGGPPAPIGQDDVDGELVRLAHSVEETLAELDQHAGRIEDGIRFHARRDLSGAWRDAARAVGVGRIRT